MTLRDLTSKRQTGSFPPSLDFIAFTWAEGLLESERQGKVCRDFKVIQRISQLSRWGAAYGSPAAARDPVMRGSPGGHCPGPTVLRAPSSWSRALREAAGLESIKKPLVHQSTPERFRGKGNCSPPGDASPLSSAQT